MTAYNYHYNMIKGRVTEVIIKQLFEANGYRVYDYEIECTVPQAMENVRNMNDDMAMRVRNMPDFIVQDIASGKLTYVEVKYRAKGCYTVKDIERNPYDSTCYIIVSKNAIQYITYEDLKQGSSLLSPSHDLADCDMFSLGKDDIVAFKDYARMFFEGVK